MDDVHVNGFYSKGTATDFRKHSLQSMMEVKLTEFAGMDELDSSEKVASKILEVVETGAAEGILE